MTVKEPAAAARQPAASRRRASTTPDIDATQTADGPLLLAPTDIAQYIRLDQCDRYLRLRLHERVVGLKFLRDYGTPPQEMPPLLTQSGLEFEERVIADVARRYRRVDCRPADSDERDRPSDNDRIVDELQALAPGQVVTITQPRLDVISAGWRLRGDLDLLRAERTADGALALLIVDMKASRGVRTEHKLQVAIYQVMLTQVLEQAAVAATIRTAIAFRGVTHHGAAPVDPQAAEREATQRAAALALLGSDDTFLEIVEDGAAYLDSVADLVTGPTAKARVIAGQPFDSVPFHLQARCDGCLYNPFCMKWCAEHDDLSLVPYLTGDDKLALQRASVTMASELATLKSVMPASNGDDAWGSTPGREDLVRRLASTWPVGPRLDELIVRARRSPHVQGDRLPLPRRSRANGHGSLPHVTADRHPNMVRIFVDAQRDHVHDRVYLLGALVSGCEAGTPAPHRRRSIVHLAAGPPATDEIERDLFTAWVRDLLAAIVAVAAPDEQGELCAPLHLIFYDRHEQQIVLDGLSRHLQAIMGAAPLFDFLTQLPAFDSPIASFLSEELRDRMLLPIVCPSLHEVATYLRFDWNAGPTPFGRLFQHRIFDARGRLDTPAGDGAFFASHARFGSGIPLEYAYAAWGELSATDDGGAYQQASTNMLVAFQARRLEAIEFITSKLKGNELTSQRPFRLPTIATDENAARSLAHALHEFVVIERHTELVEWKRLHQLAPERRVLQGATLLVRYLESDQNPATIAQNRENAHRFALRAGRSDDQLTEQEKRDAKWSPDGLQVRLRLSVDDLDATIADVVGLVARKAGDRLVLYPRWTVDSRKPVEQQVRFTPSPRQLLYGGRASFDRLEVDRDEDGRVRQAWACVTLNDAHGHDPGYTFGSSHAAPLVEGELYTLDEDPNSWPASWCAKLVAALASASGGSNDLNVIYDRLAGRTAATVPWPSAAAEAQARFFAGLTALHDAGVMPTFEASKQDFIARCGDDPIVLVQGPPGTGKSFTTAYALLARLQGAIVAGQDYRVVLSCMTHTAVDVLLGKLAEAMDLLHQVRDQQPEIFATYFAPALLDIPIFRLDPRDALPSGITALPDPTAPKGSARPLRRLKQERWCVVGATPGALYKLMRQTPLSASFGQGFGHCLVLDEASQVRLPEAMMAAMAARADSQLIVVGDPRQMPPIMRHQWDHEPRRSFHAYRAFESLYTALLPLQPRLIQFAESFRLHADMAEFLHRRIYHQDGIAFFSQQQTCLPALATADDYVRAALAPSSPLVVIVHDEDASQVRNALEMELLKPILAALADPASHGLDAADGYGIVVPHRAQRMALQAEAPQVAIRDVASGEIVGYAVDTVERYQGSERTVIIVSTTESDPRYLLASSGFLLDPRRLTVALSRAKQKMILIAARSIFTLFSPDEETFANAQIWRSLLRDTCRQRLWAGARHGHAVEIWGNGPAIAPDEDLCG